MVEPVELGTRTNPVDAYTDRLNLNLRTSDPANPGAGEAWVRTDLDSGDRLATLRVQGVGDVPIFPTGMSGENVVEVFRCQLPAGTGFVPLATNGTYSQLGFQHDGSAYQFHDALTADAIPDSVVSRPDDNNSTTDSRTLGLKIESTVDWPSIGAELSSNSTDFTTAYIYRESDGQLMGQTDVSPLSAGDTFVVEDVNLQSNTVYNFVMDAEGSSWTTGYLGGPPDYPFTSADSQLSIIDGAEDATAEANAASSFKRVGNVGFD